MQLPAQVESRGRLRVAFALPGLHRVLRGAEVAVESIANEVARIDGFDVTLFGSGTKRDASPYKFRHIGCVKRECFERAPRLPSLRDECSYEELTFAAALALRYRPADFDVVVTCSYPWLNWLFTCRRIGRGRPARVFITQNGDWPARDNRSEFRWFDCDALVCTNPDYFAANRDRWPSTLIPNGVDPALFSPGLRERERFGLPSQDKVAIVVSALIESKRVEEAVAVAAQVPGLHLLVAGDGPRRGAVEKQGRELMGDRFRRATIPREQMPALYRCADAMIHMSLDEPSANAYIEAMATGVPVVTHDRAVTRWTFGDTAYLADMTDRAAARAALEAAVSETGEMLRLARRQRAVERFSWSAIAQQYGEVFRAAAASRHSNERVATSP